MPSRGQRLYELAVQTRLWAALERSLIGKMGPVLNRHYRAAAAGYASGGLEASNAALQGAGRDYLKILAPHYASTGKVFAERTLDSLGEKSLVPLELKRTGPSGAFAQFEAAYAEWILSEGLRQAKRIQGVTVEQAREILLGAEVEGLGTAPAAKRLRDSASALSRVRAITIGRTETHNAATFAGQEAARSTSRELRKLWLAHPGPRTREDHWAANEQPRHLDEPYDVGGSQMMRPGDDSMGAPAKQIVQCRCSEYYEPIS